MKQKLVFLDIQEFRDNEEMKKVLKSPEFNLGYEIFTGDELPIRKERFSYKPYRKMVRYYRITRIIYLALLFLLGLGAFYYSQYSGENTSRF